MATPHQKKSARVRSEEVEEVEEIKEEDVLDVYKSMLWKVTEVYAIALEVENSEELAALLKAVEGVQVQLGVIIGRIQEEREIAKSVKEYEERSVKDESC